MAFSYSLNEEEFFGRYDTREGAIAQALEEAEEQDYQSFWIGENKPPRQPEEFKINIDDWLSHVSDQDDYQLDCAEDWCSATREQIAELEQDIKPVIVAWLDRHDLRPTHWLVDNLEKYNIVDGQAIKANPPK